MVELKPTADTGSVFVGWSGDIDCSDGLVTIDTDKSCTARIYLASDPIPDIKANGSDGEITVTTSDPLTITVELDAGVHSGENADWWAVDDTTLPVRWYYYNYDEKTGGGSWLPGFGVAYQGPLGNLSPYVVWNSPLPQGTYKIYFGVDTNMNGSLDMGQFYYDRVVVTVKP